MPYRAQAVSRRFRRESPSLRPDQSMWDLWWTKWQWARSFSEFFGFPLSMYHSTVALRTHVIWGMNNMSASGSSSET
jgi:hypothetical protein